MQISAHPIAAAPNTAANGASLQPTQQSSGPGSFAQMLSARQSQIAEAPKPIKGAKGADASDAPKPADKADSDRPEAADHAEEANNTQNATQASKSGKPMKSAGRERDAGEARRAESKPQGAQEACAADAKTATETAQATDAATTPAMDPALAQWLAGLNPASVKAEAASADAAGVDPKGLLLDGKAGDKSIAGDQATKAAGALRGDGKQIEKDATRGAKADFAAFEQAVTAAREEAQALHGQDGDSMIQGADRPASIDLQAASALAGPQAAASTSHASRVESAPPPPVVEVPTPVQSPEFAGALGVQVSVLARDGVQEAELHLNPTDMGPISVRIALDGAQARVDFGADSAPTRQIIEAGLPELASALRDAGFTLTGGGVSQHSRGNSQNANGGEGNDRSRIGGSRRGGVGSQDAGSARPQAMRRTQGAVDLYA